MKKIRKRLIAAGIILAGVLFGGWKLISGRQNQQLQYQTAKAEKGTIVVTVSASGNVLTGNTMLVTTHYSLRSAKDTAWKKFYDLAVGGAYQNGDGSPRDDIRNSSAEFQSLQADWLAAEAKYKNQQAVINQSKAALNSSWLSYQSSAPTIAAAAGGTISNLEVVAGMTAEADQRVAVIQNEANPIIRVNLTEIDIPKIKTGQKATVTLDSQADKTFTGKVVTVDRIGTVSNNVTSYPAIIQLDTSSPEIFPNMAANASIIIETKSSVLLVPSAAIQIQGEESLVRVLRNGQEQQMFVQVGLSSDTQTEIISGINEGEEVITGTKNSSVFGGGGFGGGALRPGGFGGGGSRGGQQLH